ncbi:glycosyltransferase [Sulfitobacter sp. JB4-11]|uniref:glycosyltransferase n=1 Tax=Sulfitobacter rhodophyticola TaxID=3238304 RepID=UPI003518B079
MRFVALLLPNLRPGGAERVCLDLAHEFQKLGYQVEFVLLQARGELLAEVQRNFKVVDLNCDRARALPLKLWRYLRDRKPDALIAAMWPLTVIAPLAAAASGGNTKVLISEHNTLSIQYRNLHRSEALIMHALMYALYPLASARIGVSRGVVKDIARLSMLSPMKFTVIHNPVQSGPTPEDVEQRHADSLWLSPNGNRIIAVGSLKDQKNHPLLLSAFAKLNQPDAQLMIVGDGALRPSLEQHAANLNIADRVIFAGYQPDPTPFYHSADLFVLSSNYEGFGNVIVEALSCGTPVVSTNCPSGPAEILEDGRWGTLTPVGDADALAAAMQSSLDKSHDTEALKRRAADFAPEIAARKYLQALGMA